ncbi:MAG TPA: bifunctional phosphoribosylaminoimidazolecarboxamide formyltransferase/IMP cyclohydrolase [Pyrinomonadaceae bacterium]|nr:bifunctional phosphoribosylaminoimidazolecarboxamide formyltransferase/IMP cyclohydrolase [Pyrinomonadaceae bacterium]
MTDNQQLGLRKIRRALISVSDKTGVVEFAQELKRFGVEIISTGGTASALRAAGIDVLDVSDVTGFPEMMDGRVKTLHPRIHGALLGIRANAEHQAAMQRHGIQPIDLVVINLYPFEETIAREGVTLEEAVEQIDIGGPALIRSAAKNFPDVMVLVGLDDYEELLTELSQNDGATVLQTRQRFAARAFHRTAGYDGDIFRFLASRTPGFPQAIFGRPGQAYKTEIAEQPEESALIIRKVRDLRYGENPHQEATLYEIGTWSDGLAHAELLNGKEMSFNNYVDADAAWQLVSDFDQLCCAIIKHTNPAGVGLGNSAEQAYRRALETDPVSAFGGIVAFNSKVDAAAAKAVIEIFTEVIVAPDYDVDALDLLKAKKNLRVLRLTSSPDRQGLEYKQISGGMLVQTRDTHKLNRGDLKVVSKRQPTEAEIEALLFAWTVCKHTKSNAIVYARAGQTVGVGAGQMSRVDSVKLGAMRAQIPVAGSVLASDAFFPFRDGIDEAAKHGITAVIQPGGSVRDAEVIAAGDEHGLAMVFTGIRHFKH